MSYKAQDWAWKQHSLETRDKLILLALCYRFNDQKGCFPAQTTIANDTGFHTSTVNLGLTSLEATGFIRREKPEKGRRSTRYYFAFENDFCVSHGNSVDPNNHSHNERSDTPTIRGEALLQEETNKEREQVTKQVNSREGFFSEMKSDPEPSIDEQFEEAWNAYPKKQNDGSRKASEINFKAALKKIAFDDLLRAIKNYANSRVGKDAQFTKSMNLWLVDEYWTGWLGATLVDLDRARYRKIAAANRA